MIAEKLQYWMWKEKRWNTTILSVTTQMKLEFEEIDMPYKIINKDKIHLFIKKLAGCSYKNKVKVPIKKTKKSHHRL